MTFDEIREGFKEGKYKKPKNEKKKERKILLDNHVFKISVFCFFNFSFAFP